MTSFIIHLIGDYICMYVGYKIGHKTGFMKGADAARDAMVGILEKHRGKK